MHARSLIPAVLVVGLVAPAAAAEDFTGFYAGVNAGYGFGRNAVESAPGVPPVPGDRSKAGDDLPPSAARAADRDATGRVRPGR